MPQSLHGSIVSDVNVKQSQRLTFSQRCVVTAIALSPFQWALTLNLGFPLKLSEILLMMGIAAYFLFPRHVQPPSLAGRIIVLMGVVLLLSTVTASLSSSQPLLFRGFTRSPGTDLLMYCGYGLLILLAWFPLRSIPRDLFGKALVVAAWIVGTTSLFQLVMVEAGQTALLGALNFTVEGTGSNLFGGDAGTRSGPFLEGQHLGFYAGALAIVCLGRRAWFGMVWCLWACLYAQSTTALVGFIVAAGIAIVLRLSLRAVMALGAGLIMSVVAVQIIPAAREFITFQLAKLGLFGLNNNYDYATLSLETRDVKSTIGFQMMRDSPITGVGPGRYGAYFFDYPLSNDLPMYYYNADHRAIAENAYAQVAAEIGILMLALLIFLLLVLLWRNRTAHISVFALIGYLAVGMLTQSSWTFIPIWILIAYVSTAIPSKISTRLIKNSVTLAGTSREIL